MEGELGEEVKGQEEEDNAQKPVRMTMTMDEMEIHCEALSQCDSVNKLNDSSTHGAHRAQCARLSRLCESWSSCSWSQWSQDC